MKTFLFLNSWIFCQVPINFPTDSKPQVLPMLFKHTFYWVILYFYCFSCTTPVRLFSRKNNRFGCTLRCLSCNTLKIFTILVVSFGAFPKNAQRLVEFLKLNAEVAPAIPEKSRLASRIRRWTRQTRVCARPCARFAGSRMVWWRRAYGFTVPPRCV